MLIEEQGFPNWYNYKPVLFFYRRKTSCYCQQDSNYWAEDFGKHYLGKNDNGEYEKYYVQLYKCSLNNLVLSLLAAKLLIILNVSYFRWIEDFSDQ